MTPKDYAPPTNLDSLREQHLKAKIERIDRLLTNTVIFVAGVMTGTVMIAIAAWVLKW